MRDGECAHGFVDSCRKVQPAFQSRARQHHRELLATEACGRSAGRVQQDRIAAAIFFRASSPARCPCESLKRPELIDIGYQDRERRLFARGTTPFRRSVFIESPPVVQLGEAVGIHEPLKLEVRFKEFLLALSQRAIRVIALLAMQGIPACDTAAAPVTRRDPGIFTR